MPTEHSFLRGSPESRAIARAIAEKRLAPPDLTPEEFDCGLLYGSAVYLTAGSSPDYSQLEATEAYKRGREIRQRYSTPSIENVSPEDLEARESRMTMVERAQLYIDAWQRRIPHLPCPWRIVDGHWYVRQRPNTTPCPLSTARNIDGENWQPVRG